MTVEPLQISQGTDNITLKISHLTDVCRNPCQIFNDPNKTGVMIKIMYDRVS